MLWSCAGRFEGHRIGLSLLCRRARGAVCVCMGLHGCQPAETGVVMSKYLHFRCRVGRMCTTCPWKGIAVGVLGTSVRVSVLACAHTPTDGSGSEGPFSPFISYLSINPSACIRGWILY